VNRLLGFVTSLRARAVARDWTRHVWMLERTVDSMLATGTQDVVVVCHEPPPIAQASDPRVTVMPLDVPVPQRNNDAMCVDKVLKVSAGIAALQTRGVRYIGICDADDLVHRELGAFIAARDGGHGWYAPVMLTYAYGGRWIRRRVMPEAIAGPFAVVRADLLQFAEPPFHGWWVERARADGEDAYLAALAAAGRAICAMVAAGHTRYCDVLAREGHPLAPLPFNAHLMINHDDSTSTVEGGAGTAQRPSPAQIARHAYRWVPELRPLTSAMRRDFAIPFPVPAAYSGASVLWR
jgi:hypothetical protein